jgi:putative intracellular protease/amidase
MPMERVTCHIGILLFADMTQIDFTGPYEILARLPDTCVHVVAKTIDPVRTDRGLILVPTVSCADCPTLDVIVVPGGPGQQALMDDEKLPRLKETRLRRGASIIRKAAAAPNSSPQNLNCRRPGR